MMIEIRGRPTVIADLPTGVVRQRRDFADDLQPVQVFLNRPRSSERSAHETSRPLTLLASDKEPSAHDEWTSVFSETRKARS